MPLGRASDKVSTREELLKSPVVTGTAAVPTHTPEIPAQDYYGKGETASYHVWKNGVWLEVFLSA